MSEFQEKVKDIQEKVKNHGLIMSRVPETTRDFFIKLAEEHFSDDYGLTLCFLCDEIQRRSILETLDIKLNYIVSMLESKETNEEKPKATKKIRMLNGDEKIIGKEGQK